MHGRRKVKTPEDKLREKKEKDKIRSAEYAAVIKKAFEMRASGDKTQEAMKITEAILSGNADCYSIWNYRRETILALKADMSAEDVTLLCNQEFAWLERVLAMWPKSYWVWFHREWISEFFTPDWHHELHLCELMHKADRRNFHCWNYRRFAAKKASASAQSELEMTMKLIENDPSNYSAWHYRSILLPKVFESPETLSKAISDEFELIQQAIWTDPGDQSAWLYHHWLVGVRKNRDQPRLKETLEEQIQSCTELLEEEPNSKWVNLTIVLLSLELGEFDQDDIVGKLKKLQDIDPAHSVYYSELSKKALAP